MNIENPLKQQAEQIMTVIDQELQTMEAQKKAVPKELDTKANDLMSRLSRVVNDVDIKAAEVRVQKLKEKHPNETAPELAQRLIQDKCQRTGMVGAVTSGAGLIPGIGTMAAMTLGVAADIGATFKLQAELVLEVASVYDYQLTQEEKNKIIMTVTGLSAGTSALARRAGLAASEKFAEKFAEKSILKALPIIGVIASAGTNVLSTYVIGQRADAYFRLGPDAVGSWSDSLRTISGVDERKIGHWLAESGKATGEAITDGAGKMVIAGQAAQGGLMVVFHKADSGIQAILRFLGWPIGFVWGIVTFLPSKVMGLFKKKNPNP